MEFLFQPFIPDEKNAKFRQGLQVHLASSPHVTDGETEAGVVKRITQGHIDHKQSNQDQNAALPTAHFCLFLHLVLRRLRLTQGHDCLTRECDRPGFKC